VLVGIALVIQILCSYFEDSKSSKITESVETLVPKHVDTDRNREKISIQESQQYDLLREDSELAKVDDRGPADLQKVDASVMVGNSWLSGKSELLARKPEKTSGNPLETKHLAFFSNKTVKVLELIKFNSFEMKYYTFDYKLLYRIVQGSCD